MTMKNVPNCITGLRILGTIVLLFIKPFTIGFLVLYTFCGFTDVLDGWIARKLHVTSELGSKLDSVADLLYYGVMLFKILPVLIAILPKYMWCMIFAVIIVRFFSYMLAAVRYKCFVSHHTYMNKVSGFFIFFLPYFIKLSIGVKYCILLVVITGVSTLEELLMHILYKEYRADRKTILSK